MWFSSASSCFVWSSLLFPLLKKHHPTTNNNKYILNFFCHFSVYYFHPLKKLLLWYALFLLLLLLLLISISSFWFFFVFRTGCTSFPSLYCKKQDVTREGNLIQRYGNSLTVINTTHTRIHFFNQINLTVNQINFIRYSNESWFPNKHEKIFFPISLLLTN